MIAVVLAVHAGSNKNTSKHKYSATTDHPYPNEKLFYYYFNWQNIVTIKSIGNSGNMRMASHVLSLVLVFFPGMFLLGGSSIIYFLSQAY